MASKLLSTGWRYARSGPISEVLKLETFDVIPAKNQAVVRVLSAPMHRVDAGIVNGTVLGRKRVTMQPFARVGGSEGVGLVVSTGGSRNFKEGDMVWIAPLHGTWASLITAPQDMLHKVNPKWASLAVNASNYLLAQQLLHGYASLKGGQVVVQNGGSSVTSLAVSALAKAMHVRVLTAATPGERYAAAKSRHAVYNSEVFEYNGRGARAMEAALGKDASVVLYLNGVGGRYFDTFLKLLGPRGDAVTYGAQNGYGLMFSGSNLIYKEATMHGVYLPTYLNQLSYQERQTQLEFVLQTLSEVNFAYPTVTTDSLDQLPKVWDDLFVHGGAKGVIRVSN